MKYKLLTWNINFLHDNWLKRLNTINKTLEKEMDDCDIITLQEATLPFSNTIESIHNFLIDLVDHLDHKSSLILVKLYLLIAA